MVKGESERERVGCRVLSAKSLLTSVISSRRPPADGGVLTHAGAPARRPPRFRARLLEDSKNLLLHSLESNSVSFAAAWERHL